MDGGERHRVCESDEIENSDESDRPSGERWAPVGANDGDNEFADEYKYVNTMEKCVGDFISLLPLSQCSADHEPLSRSIVSETRGTFDVYLWKIDSAHVLLYAKAHRL